LILSNTTTIISNNYSNPPRNENITIQASAEFGPCGADIKITSADSNGVKLNNAWSTQILIYALKTMTVTRQDMTIMVKIRLVILTHLSFVMDRILNVLEKMMKA